jgi:GTP cyclohydrolase I
MSKTEAVNVLRQALDRKPNENDMVPIYLDEFKHLYAFGSQVDLPGAEGTTMNTVMQACRAMMSDAQFPRAALRTLMRWLTGDMSEDTAALIADAEMGRLQDSGLDVIGLLTDVLLNRFGAAAFDDGAHQTARRVIGYWNEMARFLEPGEEASLPFEFTTFDADKGQMVTVPNIEFSSMCAHHLLPFMGKVHIGYVVAKRQAGLSKFPRLVDFWAQRPQVQERLTHQLVADIKKRLEPHGVMVVVEARHSCMACRGVRKHNGAMVTSLPDGVFLSNPSARDEFFRLIDPYRGD